MDALTSWLEKYILPVAAKIGAQKHLVALRDAFIGTMPATMAGSVAVMINAIIRDLPPQFFPGYDGNTIPVIKEIIAINGYVWNGTLAIAGVIFAFSWGYNLAKAYGVNDLAGGIVSLAASIAGVIYSFSGALEIEVPSAFADLVNAGTADTGWSATADGLAVSGWGWIPLRNMDSNFYFTAMIIGFVATVIFAKLMLANITIKMPEQVPPAVSKAFAAIIPATVALYVVAIFYWLFAKVVPDMNFITWLQETIAKPLLNFSEGYGAVLVMTLFVQLFWFFGIHGTNVLAPILEGVFSVKQLDNVNLFQEGGLQNVLDNGYLWVRGSFDQFAWFGGAGGTIMLIIAILIFSKRSDYRAVANLSLGPGIFNINEPVMFGLPIVLNAIMFIPYLLAPLVSVSIGYAATVSGLVNPVSQQITWVTPPLISAFLATGADWRAVVVSLICMLVTFAIYVPFVIAANKLEPGIED
ncbi:PTS sugar transporter subunit IIC [Enterococcus sp. LJL90]